MANMNLLKITNSVLSAMEAETVSTIDESVESEAIVRIAEEVYYELITKTDWPHLTTATTLTSLSDNTKPNYLEIPTEVRNIKSLWYNGTELKYKSKEDFINFTNARDLSSDNVVEVTTYNGVSLKIVNDQDPVYFTIFEDKYVVTNSYDSVTETTIQGSNSTVVATVYADWTSTDSFVPALTDTMVPTYLAMVKKAAFLYLRREQSIKDEIESRAGLGRMFRDVSKLHNEQRVPNYGR